MKNLVKTTLLGLVSFFTIGLSACGSKAVTYVSSYNQNTTLTVEGENVTFLDKDDESEFMMIGTFKEETYTTKCGGIYAYTVYWTEASFDGVKEVLEEPEKTGMNYSDEAIDYVSKENNTEDDVIHFVKN